ncbi:hypothetical protein F4779DRAFT_607021 [Xylariaceae sp. FL0662B]|nr:hypothetical protein F4779DRAFT_607021 [Xylariaceae sp. FL0662B]
MSSNNPTSILALPAELRLSIAESIKDPTDLFNFLRTSSEFNSLFGIVPLLLYKTDARFHAKNKETSRTFTREPGLLWAIRNIDDLVKLGTIVEIFQKELHSTSLDDNWDNCYATPVEAAIRAHKLDVLQLLVKKGLGLRCRDWKCPRTKLLTAFQRYKLRPDIEYWQDETYSFELACWEQQENMALWMIEYFAREQGRVTGLTEMECAVTSQNPKVVRALLSATPYFRDTVYRDTSDSLEPEQVLSGFLQHAVQTCYREPEIIDIFLEAGALIISDHDYLELFPFNAIGAAVSAHRHDWAIRLLKLQMSRGPISESALADLTQLEWIQKAGCTDFLRFFYDNFSESSLERGETVSEALLETAISGSFDKYDPYSLGFVYQKPIYSKFTFLMEIGYWYSAFELLSSTNSRTGRIRTSEIPIPKAKKVRKTGLLASLCLRAISPGGAEGARLLQLLEQIRSGPCLQPDLILFAPSWKKIDTKTIDQELLDTNRLEAVFRFALADGDTKKLLLEKLDSIRQGDEALTKSNAYLQVCLKSQQ